MKRTALKSKDMKHTSYYYVKKSLRERSFFAALMICLSALFLGMGFLIYTGGENRYQMRSMYGFHDGSMMNATEEAEQFLKGHRAVKAVGVMQIYGRIMRGQDIGEGYIGAVDEGFKNMENLIFLEGGYPQKEGEIAMEYRLLDTLHIPYEIGSTITLSIEPLNGEGSRENRSFVLCGILDCFTNVWEDNGYPLCGAFTVFGKEAKQKQIFFTSIHKSEEDMKELSGFPASEDGEENVLCYNWSGKKFDVMVLSVYVSNAGFLFLLVVTSVLLLAGIQVVSAGKQQHRLKLFLLLGVRKRRLSRLLFAAAIRQWLHCYMVTAAAATLCMGLCYVWKQDILADTNPLLWISFYLVPFMVSFPAVCLGRAAQTMRLAHGDIVPRGKDLTRYGVPVIKRSDAAFSEKEFVRMEKQLYKKIFRLEKGILAAGLMGTVLAFYVLIYIQGKTFVSDTSYRWNAWDGQGLTLAEISRIQQTENMEEVCYFTEIGVAKNTGIITGENGEEFKNRYLYISYEGYADTGYEKSVNSVFWPEWVGRAVSGIKLSAAVLPENSPALSYLKTEYADCDWEAFEKGKKIFCYMPDIIWNDKGGVVAPADGVKLSEGDILCHTPLSAGDIVTVQYDGKNRQAEIGKIFAELPDDRELTGLRLVNGILYVSEVFYRSLCGKEEILYNQVEAFADASLNYGVIDKKMSAVTENTNVVFSNDRLRTAAVLKQRQKFLLLLSSLYTALLFTIWMSVYKNRQHLYACERERIWLLKHYGLQKKAFRQLYRNFHAGFSVLCVLAANAVFFLWFSYYTRWDLYPGLVFWDRWRMSVLYVTGSFPWKSCILLQAGAGLLLGLAMWLPYRKCHNFVRKL